uniref:Calmodulin regulated spectrin-associated protein 1a n=1 Tax=Salarias fasciatus TaxID=181472 RepID=A0A672HSM5_SALFA
HHSAGLLYHIPPDLRDPFYTDQYEQEHIKPPVLRLLLSAELYCRVCGLILHGEQAASLQSHQAVIQALSRRGVYVLETDSTPLTENLSLVQSAHIHLIDALMTAYMVEMISIEKVVSSVKRFSNFSASKELPFDLEDAMLFWINKVNMKMREITEKECKMKQHLLDSPSHQKVRYRRDHLSGRTLQHFPLLDDLLKDVSDGAALLALVHFYCPELIRLEDICLKEIPSIADSLYNIQLLKEFSNEYLNRCFYLKPEDLLYSPPVLKSNVMVFIAELFWWFESVKPDFVQPRDLQDRAGTGPTSRTEVPSWPGRRGGPGEPIGHSCTLPVTISVPDEDLSDRSTSCSVAPPSRPVSQPVPYALHFALEDDADSVSLARSISKDSLASNILSITPKHAHRLSGQSLLSHIRIEDEEEEVEEEELVAVVHPSVFSRRRAGSDMEQDELETPNAPLNKQEESGEGRCRARRGAAGVPQRKSPVVEAASAALRPSADGSTGATPAQGFFLHLSEEPDFDSPFSSVLEPGPDSDSDIADLEDEDFPEYAQAEGESDKLRDDLKVSERGDKEDGSGRSSPCPSTVSWASSCSASGSNSIKMTSFAERKLLKLGLREGYSSTSSSQKTTPDGPEAAPCPPWQLKSDPTPGWLGKEPGAALGKSLAVSPSAVPSELLQLHMRLEEQRRAIEYQKKKMETLSARQRLKLGKAAFLNIVKKGGGRSDTLPLPLRHSHESKELTAADRSKARSPSSRDDSCLDALKLQARAEEGQIGRDNKLSHLSPDGAAEPDLNECSRSIDLLNEAIGAIQQQMLQLSFQQDLLMKHNAASPSDPAQSAPSTTPSTTDSSSSTSDSRPYAVHFVDIGGGGGGSVPARRPPRLTSSQRSRTSERKQSKSKTERTPSPKGDREAGSAAESAKTERSILRKSTFKVHDAERVADKPQPQLPPASPPQNDGREENTATNSGSDAVTGDEGPRVKGQLIEVDLSEVKDAPEDGGADGTESTAEGEQKNVLGFFFKVTTRSFFCFFIEFVIQKSFFFLFITSIFFFMFQDDEKAEDEMAKRRAAFLLKQQRKAEEARLRKLQQEAESELKRDEARRKAEEDRIRKEEEKARRELIKQEYLRRKQQALMEEQGLVKPRPRPKSRRNRPKSLHREESGSLSKGSATRKTTACFSSGLFPAESVCSVESFPLLSRASSRNMERDWENGSIASSITSIEYNGPKLFKEPSSKSNKPIIVNAIAHCCLAGKVNEVQKNVILEELEKCESNHLIILFRDGGCQFRAVYSYSPDTEEIVKFTGTGPRAIGRKMIDKLYKYSSDRKQFTVIPAKSVSVSVDALTIHNHLWQVKRPGSARRK